MAIVFHVFLQPLEKSLALGSAVYPTFVQPANGCKLARSTAVIYQILTFVQKHNQDSCESYLTYYKITLSGFSNEYRKTLE